MSVEHQTEQVGDGSEVAESVQLLTISAKNMACGEYKISGCCFWTCKLARFHLFPLHIVSCIYILFYVAHRQLLKMSFSNNFYLSLGGHSAVEFTADTTSVGSNVWNGNQAWFLRYSASPSSPPVPSQPSWCIYQSCRERPYTVMNDRAKTRLPALIGCFCLELCIFLNATRGSGRARGTCSFFKYYLSHLLFSRHGEIFHICENKIFSKKLLHTLMQIVLTKTKLQNKSFYLVDA